MTTFPLPKDPAPRAVLFRLGSPSGTLAIPLSISAPSTRHSRRRCEERLLTASHDSAYDEPADARGLCMRPGYYQQAFDIYGAKYRGPAVAPFTLLAEEWVLHTIDRDTAAAIAGGGESLGSPLDGREICRYACIHPNTPAWARECLRRRGTGGMLDLRARSTCMDAQSPPHSRRHLPCPALQCVPDVKTKEQLKADLSVFARPLAQRPTARARALV